VHGQFEDQKQAQIFPSANGISALPISLEKQNSAKRLQKAGISDSGEETALFDVRQSKLEQVTSYAPATIVVLGLVKAIFGLMVIGLGVLAFCAGASGDSAPRQPGDLPQWWMMVVGAGLGLFGFALASGGVGRIVSAFASGCYFKAGDEGLAVRLPKQGWFGRFRIVEYQFKWEEIESLYPLTRSINLIPIARELHIRLFGGRDITIERFYFSTSSKQLCEMLLKMRAQAGQ
jgi:hypothetical protein